MKKLLIILTLLFGISFVFIEIKAQGSEGDYDWRDLEDECWYCFGMTWTEWQEAIEKGKKDEMIENSRDGQDSRDGSEQDRDERDIEGDNDREDNDISPEEALHRSLRAILVAMNVPNANSIPIQRVENCASTARVMDGIIQICNRFYEKSFVDQVAILWHEFYHINNDASWSADNVIVLDVAVSISDIPQEMHEYIINTLIEDEIRDQFLTEMYEYETSLKNIQEPSYYQNEVNAYRAEIQANPNVSEVYKAEREFLLWRYEQFLIISRQYHDK